ncbi:MAG: helix-turn-helix transcriptional regulator [Frankia sp.]|nr:helix-turn-helix transcriptional regulator [Frankia sp.]
MVGDRWALLVIRELLFGNHRFDEIAHYTGAPRDRLTARLRTLEAAGVVIRRQYSDRPPRFEYHLTDAGRDLAPVINALRAWGERWVVESPPIVVRHACGQPLETVTICRHCGQKVRRADLKLESRAEGWEIVRHPR